MESVNTVPDADDLKRQIRRRIFKRDFQRGEAELSRFAAFFVICPTCRGRRLLGSTCQNGDYWYGPCEQCDGAGFIERDLSEKKEG